MAYRYAYDSSNGYSSSQSHSSDSYYGRNYDYEIRTPRYTVARALTDAGATTDPVASSRYGGSSSSHDSRYGQSSSLHSSAPTVHRTKSRRKRRWPPAPSVEDETESLAKEFGSRTSVGEKSGDEASHRGTVDQEPLIIELENHERRFVLVPNGDSSDEASTKGRTGRRQQQTPRLYTTVDSQVPLRRERSPYSYTPSFSRESTKSDDFLSPGHAQQSTPTSSSSSRHHRTKSSNVGPDVGGRISPGRSDKTTADPRRPSTANSDNGTFGESDIEQEDALRVLRERKPARYSFHKPEKEVFTRASDIRDFAAAELKERPRSPYGSSNNNTREDVRVPETRIPPLPTRPKDVNRRSTESPPTSNPYNRYDPTYPSKPPSLSRTTTADTMSSNNGKSNSSRPASPNMPKQTWPPSPPHSPRPPSQSGHSSSNEHSRSRPGSAGGSRPSSPSPLAMYDSARPPHGLGINTRHSKLANSTPQDAPSPRTPRIGVQSPSPGRQQNVPLPYPEDDHMTMMPEMPDPYGDMEMPKVRRENSYESNSSASSPAFGKKSSRLSGQFETSSPRPPLNSRATFAESVPKFKPEPTRTYSGTEIPRNDSGAGSVVPYIPRPMPPCPRSHHSGRYNDWYTIESFPDFDICPDCLEQIIGPTPFIRDVRKAPQRPAGFRVKCDFSDSWVRLAWMLTLERQKATLNLIRSIAEIDASWAPCPRAHGDSHSTSWYTIPDEYGRPIEDFQVCSTDVKKLEMLLPELKGIFIKSAYSINSYTTSSYETSCAFRTASKRWGQYLDLLVDINRTAVATRRPPDLRPFIALAKQKASLQECSRDDLVLDAKWHIIPSLPEFTVCEECYADIILPSLAAGSSIASRFTSTPRHLDDGDVGCSCQLYSPRMRRVWQKAVEDGEMGYLVRKAKERKMMELELQREARELSAVMRELREGDRRRERVKEELNRVVSEWKDWE